MTPAQVTRRFMRYMDIEAKSDPDWVYQMDRLVSLMIA